MRRVVGKNPVRRETPLFLPPDHVFEMGRISTLREGGDVTLVTTGGILHEAVAAADELKQRGVQARVISMHTIKPLDRDILIRAAASTGVIITVEEHSLIGGLGGAVAEALAEDFSGPVAFRRVALKDRFISTAGSQAFLRSQQGVDCNGIVHAVERTLGQARKTS